MFSMTNLFFYPLCAAGEERVGERSDAGVSLRQSSGQLPVRRHFISQPDKIINAQALGAKIKGGIIRHFFFVDEG